MGANIELNLQNQENTVKLLPPRRRKETKVFWMMPLTSAKPKKTNMPKPPLPERKNSESLLNLEALLRRDMLNSPRVLPTELMLMNSRLMRTNPNTKEKTTPRKVVNSMPVVLLAPNSREMKNSKDSCEYEEKRKQDPH